MALARDVERAYSDHPELVAAHEAGHAVMAAVLGVPIGGMVLGGPGPQHGAVILTDPDGADPLALAAIAAAGRAAEEQSAAAGTVLGRRALTAAPEEFRDGRDLAELCKEVAKASGQDPHELAEAVTGYAELEMARHRDAVAAIAAELLAVPRAGWLLAEDLGDVLARHGLLGSHGLP